MHKTSLAEWANLHAHLLWIYDGLVDPNGRGNVMAYDITAWLMRKGSVKVVSSSGTLCAGAGEWLFLPPGKRRQEFSPDAHILSVRFRARWPTGEDIYQGDFGLALAATSHPQLLKAAMPLMRTVAQNFPTSTVDLMQAPADLALHVRLQTLSAKWFEAVVAVFNRFGIQTTRMGKFDPRLLQAVRRLDRQPLSKPICEAEVAMVANFSVSQMNRLFHRQFGVSSRGYFERRRYQHAIASLESSSAAIKEIAFGLGFSSLPHFSAWFRKRNGVSPRAFRLAPIANFHSMKASARKSDRRTLQS
ncbi:helix-turn-helix domain-containing protein [Oleiharenicola lentus]|uniref:helix-turn-helix domain-containing protein n=1 Tax=Oleiharenicola lentus TaxID=2508720 RepID=UPI003F67EAF4